MGGPREGSESTRPRGTPREVTEGSALQDQGAHFIELSLDLFAISDFEGFLRGANPAYETVLGYSESELAGRPWLDLVHPDYRRRVLAEFETITAAGGELRNFEVRLRCRDGSYRAVLWSAKTSPDERLVYAVGKDITERQRLEEQSTRFMELSLDPLCIVDFEGRWQRLNPALERLLGRSSQELVGRPYIDVVHPDDRERAAAEALRLAIEGGETRDFEIRVRSKDGSYRTLLLTANAVVEEGLLYVVGRDYTDDRLAEEARREAEERFKAAFEQAPIGMALVSIERDRPGCFLRVNRSLCDITGLSEKALIGTDFRAIAHPDQGESDGCDVHSMLSGDMQRHEVETRLRHADGHTLWVLITLSLVKDARDRPLYLIAQIQDICERRRAEEGLLQLANVVESSGDAIIGATPDGVITSWNPSAERLFGYSPDEAIGQSVGILVPPERSAELREILDQVLSGRRVEQYETERVRKDGNRVQVSLTVSPIRDSTGDIVGVSAIDRDVTERKRVEKETTRFMELSLDLLAIGDLNGYFRRVNRAFETMLGYREDELVGHSYVELFHPEDRPSVLAEVERMASGDGETRDFEGRIACKDGSYRSTLWSGKISPDEQLIYAVGKDITERKRTERAIREIEVLERSNLQLEQFAYDASHDLGEPLRMISLLGARLGRMYGDGLDEDGRRLIASIVDGSERMQILIADLLAYSRAARDPLKRTLVDCSALLTDTLGLLQESIAEKDAAVTFDPMPTLRAQPTMLAEVFQNLLSNALKFTGESPLCVHVGADREGDAWHFSVRDNGIGIDRQQSDRVFEMFRRLHARDAYAGSGLGLSICKRIVERHGGRIRVEPALDQGSIFHFTIPDELPGPASASS